MSNVNGDRSRADRLNKKKRIRRELNRKLRGQMTKQSQPENAKTKPMPKAA